MCHTYEVWHILLQWVREICEDVELYKTSDVLKTSGVYNVQIFDVLGIEVMSESIHPMTSSHRINIEKLPSPVKKNRLFEYKLNYFL